MANPEFVSIQTVSYFPQKLNFEITMSTYRHFVYGVRIARLHCCSCSAWEWASNGVRMLWVPGTRPCRHTMETAGQTDAGVNSWASFFFFLVFSFSSLLIMIFCFSLLLLFFGNNNVHIQHMCETNTLRARSTFAHPTSTSTTRTSTRNKFIQNHQTKICQEKEKEVAVKRKERARAAVPRQVCNSQ